MPKWLKMLVGILLLPVCLGTAQALWGVLAHSGGADRFWVPLLAGVACWIIVFSSRPNRCGCTSSATN